MPGSKRTAWSASVSARGSAPRGRADPSARVTTACGAAAGTRSGAPRDGTDLGCGDGAVGEALRAKGFTNLEGLDISQGMLDIAKEKGIYQSLQKVDLLQELPLEQDTFDLAVSSAVSTYLG